MEGITETPAKMWKHTHPRDQKEKKKKKAWWEKAEEGPDQRAKSSRWTEKGWLWGLGVDNEKTMNMIGIISICVLSIYQSYH